MAAAIIAEVGFRINTSDIEALNQRMQTLEDTIEDVESETGNLGKAFKEVGSLAKKGIAIATVAVAALGAAFVVTTNKTRELVRESAKLGVGVEALQEMQFAAASLAIEADTLNDSLATMAELTSEALVSGSGSASEAINLLGINLQSLQGLNIEQTFDLYADSLADVTDEAERIKLAILLFGDAGQDLVPILSKGSKEMAKLRKEARDLGVVMTKSQVIAANKAGEATRKLTAQYANLANRIIADVAPAIEKLVDKFSDLLKDETELKGITDGLTAGLNLLGESVVFVAKHFETLVNLGIGIAILKVSSAFGILAGQISIAAAASRGATGAMIFLNRALTVLGGPIGVLFAAVTAIGLAWVAWGDDIKKWIGLGTSGELDKMNESLNQVEKSINSLTTAQLNNRKASLSGELIEAEKAAIKLNIQIKTAEERAIQASRSTREMGSGFSIALRNLTSLNEELNLQEEKQTRIKSILDEINSLLAAQAAAAKDLKDTEELRISNLLKIERINTAIANSQQITSLVDQDAGFQVDDPTLESDQRLVALQTQADNEIMLLNDLATKKKEILDLEEMDTQIRAEKKLQIEQELANKTKLISRQSAQDKADFEEKLEQQRLGQASSFFGNLASLSKTGNKKLAKIAKVAAIAQATIDGIAGVQKALASAPPPFNFILAAGVGLAAAANVAAIKSTPLAKGGVLDSPQFVGTVGGSPAIAGEAGPEAVLPLARDSQGRLGVRGGINVEGGINVTINGNADASDVESGVYAAMERIAFEQVADANRVGNINNPLALDGVI